MKKQSNYIRLRIGREGRVELLGVGPTKSGRDGMPQSTLPVALTLPKFTDTLLGRQESKASAIKAATMKR